MARKKEVTVETYQGLRQQLDVVMAKLQDPDCSIDDIESLYMQAMELTGKLEDFLEQTENRVQKIHADFEARTA